MERWPFCYRLALWPRGRSRLIGSTRPVIVHRLSRHARLSVTIGAQLARTTEDNSDEAAGKPCVTLVFRVQRGSGSLRPLTPLQAVTPIGQHSHILQFLAVKFGVRAGGS
jgi:hypothetical protein